jgi:hypothetical protein
MPNQIRLLGSMLDIVTHRLAIIPQVEENILLHLDRAA